MNHIAYHGHPSPVRREWQSYIESLDIDYDYLPWSKCRQFTVEELKDSQLYIGVRGPSAQRTIIYVNPLTNDHRTPRILYYFPYILADASKTSYMPEKTSSARFENGKDYTIGKWKLYPLTLQPNFIFINWRTNPFEVKS